MCSGVSVGGWGGSESRNFQRGVMTTVTECHRGVVREAKISKNGITYFVYSP